MACLLYPSYFASIHQYAVMVQKQPVVFDVHGHFQKQTNRNRLYLYSPNGVQKLFVPVKHGNKMRQKTKEVRIENDFKWQNQHFRSLEMAYRASPFFEYFEDDIRPVFTKKYDFLFDLNQEIFEIVNAILGIDLPYTFSETYQKNPEFTEDYRHLIVGKKDDFQNTPYPQVFENKHQFIPNLSILDLVFNEGKYAVDYLRQQAI